MVTITYKYLKDFTLAQIKEYLDILNDPDYQLVYEFEECYARKHHLIHHFETVAYMGQLFSEISKSFSYFIPNETIKLHFMFRMTIYSTDKLANLLFRCLNASYIRNEADTINFYYGLDRFMDDMVEEKVTPATWGLFYVAHKYSSSDASDE